MFSLKADSIFLKDHQDEVSLIVYANDQILPIKQWFSEVLRGKEFSGSELEPSGDGVSSIGTTSINGITALEVKGEVMEDIHRRIFFLRDKIVIEFATAYFDIYPEPSSINKILSTFKFVE